MSAAVTIAPERVELKVSDRVRLVGGDERRWWTVRAVDDRFVVLTRQRPFRPAGESFYTIIDWERGVRGPCDRLGGGWDVDEPDGCDRLLAELNAHLEKLAELAALPAGSSVPARGVEVSYRNNVDVVVLERDPGADHA